MIAPFSTSFSRFYLQIAVSDFLRALLTINSRTLNFFGDCFSARCTYAVFCFPFINLTDCKEIDVMINNYTSISFSFT